MSPVLKSIGRDGPAGFVVFLVALPLCLGIALASNTPLASGIISGAIAGIIVSWLSGSQLSVSGPAAGLTVTIVSAIALLGSFESVLVAIFLAGLLQLIFGFLRAGNLASFFPNSVIKGMLAGIGVLIILKQIPHAVGWDADFDGDESFLQTMDSENSFSEILRAFERFGLGTVLIAIASLGALLFWGTSLVKNNTYLAKIPAQLIAVVAGCLANLCLKIGLPQLALMPGSPHLVNIPIGGIFNFFGQLPHPNWSVINNFATWRVAAGIALIASIETLLSIEACDKIDPEMRVSDTNRELKAQGIGNILCGLMGGLPMTSVIVRSSANVYAGGRTRLSCFVHGLLLLSTVLVVPILLNKIPLATLAVVLILVGYKLINWGVIKSVLDEGFEQALPFFVTIVAIIFTDLLIGVSVGLVVGLLIVIRMNHHSAITKVSDGNDILIRFAKDVNFAHKSELKKILTEIPEDSKVVIDGSGAHFIDHDILDAVSDFRDGSSLRNIRVSLKNMQSKRLSVRGVRNG
jgi:MFS superfamily sulfate permease-like transporter